MTEITNVEQIAPAYQKQRFALLLKAEHNVGNKKEEEGMSKIPENCPKCGAENITKLTMHKKKTQKGQGCGCVGFLLIIIIMIIAPLLLPVLGLGALAGLGGFGVLVSENQEVFMTIGGIGLVIWVINAYQISRTYICEKCGKKFK